jgi:hypothetical protein
MSSVKIDAVKDALKGINEFFLYFLHFSSNLENNWEQKMLVEIY